MDAQNQPIRRRKEIVSHDFPVQDQKSVDLSLGKPLERTVAFDAKDIDADSLMQKEYLDALKFNEEPVTISLSSTQEKNPPKWIPCWVNGKGAELKMPDGSWQAWGYIPVDVEVTTKRKYVEVLLGSKVTNVRTEHDDANVETPRNLVHKVTSQNVIVSILEDKSPLAREWMRRIRARA